MKYPQELEIVIKNELSDLLERIKNKSGCFSCEIVEKYYENYNNLKKVEKE